MFTYNGEDQFEGMENEAQLLLLKIAEVYQLQFPNIDQLKIVPKNVDDHNEYLVDTADKDILLGKLLKTLELELILELFSWKTTSYKDNLEVGLPNSRLLSSLIWMWSNMKITLCFF